MSSDRALIQHAECHRLKLRPCYSCATACHSGALCFLQGLNATLLVRHPETSQPIVNFDKDIAKLVKEAKYMKRMGIPIPSVAQMVLLQVRAQHSILPRAAEIRSLIELDSVN